jgi:hypothetical protein
VHEAIYRCINEACGRPTPRPVNFCPWCGTAQSRAGAAPVPGAAGLDAAPPSVSAGTPAGTAAAAAAAAGASAAAALSGWSDAPLPPEVPLAGAGPDSGSAAGRASPAAARSPAPPSATEFGRSGKSAAAGPTSAPPRQEVPRPPLEARPPERAPIRLRWWLVALALLWGVWLLAKPSAKKIERQIDQAVALARECKGSEAQAELIALRKSRATQEQLQRLQQALNDEAAKCTKRRQRGKAWNEASGAVETALAAASWDKARTRLQAFTRRWGEDEDTRALRTRIEDLRREDMAHRTHPLAAPEGAPGTPSRSMASGDSRPGGAVGYSGAGATGAGGGGGDATQSARNLVDSARRDLARGDFGAAADKMTLCLTMVDAGNRECRALKAQAEQEGKLQ